IPDPGRNPGHGADVCAVGVDLRRVVRQFRRYFSEGVSRQGDYRFAVAADACHSGDPADPQGCPHARGGRQNSDRSRSADRGRQPPARPGRKSGQTLWSGEYRYQTDRDVSRQDREPEREDSRCRVRRCAAERRHSPRSRCAARGRRIVPTTAPPDARTQPSWLEAIAVYLKPRVLIVMFLGFSSGLPLALSGATLLVWMRESGVNLATIGLFALVGTPYTVKFLWAPLTDALDVPVLSRLLGRRRGWLVFTQILLMAAIVFLGFCNPATSPALVAFGALLVATASATQDIVVDAFRVESLPENEQAAGMASYVAAYRIGMLVSTAGALFLVSGLEGMGLAKQAAWQWGYVAMAVLVLIGTATALLATEPERSVQAEATHAGQRPFARVSKAAVGAFRDFLGYDLAFVMLAFVVLFKFTDALSGAMTAPFVIDLGFSRNEYAAIVKGVGL